MKEATLKSRWQEPERRCAVCGLNKHRYMFPLDGDKHEPTAVACANNIISAIEQLIELKPHVGPDGYHLPMKLIEAITNMAYAVDSGGWRREK